MERLRFAHQNRPLKQVGGETFHWDGVWLVGVDPKSPERRYSPTPAMAAGVVTRLMDISDLVAMLEESEKKAA